MANTYINFANGDDLVGREVGISSYELVMYNFGRSGNPCIVPVGIMEIL
jgi:hypothetical protein